MTNSYRWNPYVLNKGSEVNDLWTKRYCSKNSKTKLLYIMGKGFDVRMNLGISQLLACNPNIVLECWIIIFNERKGSSSHQYKHLVDENLKELEALLTPDQLIQKEVILWEGDAKNKRKVGDKNVCRLIDDNKTSLLSFDDIIVDISALPRGIYFSLIGTTLNLIDRETTSKTNLFVNVAENPEIDSLTQESDPGEVYSPWGFKGGLDLSSEVDQPIIWFPILGSERIVHTKKTFDRISEDKQRLYEISPTLPFPSRDIRSSDSLLISYHDLLFESFGVEPQNITYIPEQNPFEAYLQLGRMFHNYGKSLKILSGDCKAMISPFSSKVLSIGALMVAYEFSNHIGILNVDSEGYELADEGRIKSIKKDSELILTWLTGIPYE